MGYPIHKAKVFSIREIDNKGDSEVELSLVLEYSWILLILIGLEGLLAADNALVLAIMVKHLPEEERKKALFYGLAGAFIFRFASLFAISFLVHIWQVQAIGAIYLMFIALNHFFRKWSAHQLANNQIKMVLNKRSGSAEQKSNRRASFWLTVLKVEVADIAFAIDSILAAIALAMALPETALPKIGGLDGGKFLVIFAGGFIGVIIMRFAATYFVKLLHSRPRLEDAAFMIVGWVGIKLAILTLAHDDVAFISSSFAHSTLWKTIFYTVLVIVAVGGFFLSKPGVVEQVEEKQHSH